MALSDYERTPKDYFRIYIEAQEHFKRQKYDLFGDCRIPIDEQWEKLSGQDVFCMWADRFTVREYLVIALSNNMYGHIAFPFNTVQAIKNYERFKARRAGLSEMVKGDMCKLFGSDKTGQLRNNWKQIVDYEEANFISFESLVVLNYVVPIAKYLLKVSKADTMSFLANAYNPIAIRLLKSNRLVSPTREILLGVEKVIVDGESPYTAFP